MALIDGSHPREKPCGGGVTGRATELVGLPPSGVPITGAAFEFGGRRADVPLEPRALPRLAVYPRRTFDAYVFDRARAAGADIVLQRVTDVARADDGWSVRCRGGDAAPHELQARWLIGADGANSMIRKRVAAPFPRSELSIACGYFVHGVTGTRIDIRFEDSPQGYLWSFPRTDHLAVGICAQADVATAAALLPRVRQWIDEHAPGGTLERYSWPIPSLSAAALERETPAGDSWLLIGDAAGLVDPVTREGIYFALESAEAAAAALNSAAPAARYSERLRDTIYRELTVAARIKARFYRPGFMALLIHALQRSPKIRAVMADLAAGDQPYSTLRRRLLVTLEVRLMLELFGLRSTRRALAP